MTREEALRLAEDEREYRSRSHVEAAQTLALFLLQDEKDRRALLENLASVQQRCGELLEDRRTLCRVIGRLKDAHPDEREALIAEGLSACAGMQ